MIEILTGLYRRIREFFKGGKSEPEIALVEISETVTEEPVQETVAAVSQPVAESVSESRWRVYPCRDSPFEKIGRVFIESGYLAIRLDPGQARYMMRMEELDAVLDNPGLSKTVRVDDGTVSGGAFAGSARLSSSGMALNFKIGEVFYTIPLRLLGRVLDGKNRKAPVFGEKE